MDHAEFLEHLTEIKAAIEAQTAGLMRMLSIVAAHGKMLGAILRAVTIEPEDKSPLTETLDRLVVAVQANREALHRIEGAITRSPLC